jgi:hypothetical protein
MIKTMEPSHTGWEMTKQKVKEKREILKHFLKISHGVLLRRSFFILNSIELLTYLMHINEDSIYFSV